MAASAQLEKMIQLLEQILKSGSVPDMQRALSTLTPKAPTPSSSYPDFAASTVAQEEFRKSLLDLTNITNALSEARKREKAAEMDVRQADRTGTVRERAAARARYNVAHTATESLGKQQVAQRAATELYGKEAQKSYNKDYEDFLENFKSVGKSGLDLIEQFNRLRANTEDLDKKFEELSKFANSKEARAMLGDRGQQKLQDDILRERAKRGDRVAGDELQDRTIARYGRNARVLKQGIGVAGGAHEGGAAGGLGDMFGNFSKLAGGFKTLGGATLGVVGGMFKGVESLNKWTESLHQSNMKFAEFSGAMATVAASAEAHKIQMDQLKGEARASSARELEQSRYEKERAWAPAENMFAKAWNAIGTGWNKASTLLGTAVSGIFGALDESKEDPETERWQMETRTFGQGLRGETWNGPKPPKGRFEQ